MTVRELKRQQLQELKIKYYDDQLMENEERGISYGEMVEIDELVSDEKIFEEYDAYCFTDEDFSPVEEESEGDE